MEAWPTDRRSLVELAAVVATGLLHLLFEEVFHAKAPFIALALVGWCAYLVLSVRRDRGLLKRWGLTTHNLAAACVGPGSILVLGAGLLALVGALRGGITLTWHMLVILAVYPIWGIAQQFMVQAMVVRNLRGRVPSAAVVTVIGAVMFGVVHVPDLFLMAATFLLGLLFIPLYLWRRSIVPLGLVHGWLGALAYYWLLQRDPFLELFG